MILLKRPYGTIIHGPVLSTLRLALLATCVFSASGGIAAPGVASADKEQHFISGDIYQKTLDILLPRRIIRHAQYSLVLRFSTFSVPEYQFNITADDAGNVEVYRYSMLTKSSLDQEIQQFREAPFRNDPEKLARHFKSEKSKIQVPEGDVRSILEEYSRLRVLLDQSDKILLDGTLFECWYDAGNQKTYLMDAGSGGAAAGEFVRWMERTRNLIEKYDDTSRKRRVATHRANTSNRDQKEP